MDCSKVIVKRVPRMESLISTSTGAEDVEHPCDCIDDIFNVPSPACKRCNGIGIIKVNTMTEEPVPMKVIGTKKSWITLAKVSVDRNDVIYDEEDDIYITDVHVFFHPDEDVMVGDIIIPTGQQVSYEVKDIRDVVDANDVIMRDCGVVVYSPSFDDA